MAHNLLKVFKERTYRLEMPYCWVVQCTCKWKEKATTETAVMERFEHHQKFPHKNDTS